MSGLPPLDAEQKETPAGVFAGVVAAGLTFKEVAKNSDPNVPEKPKLIFEERIKKTEHPLDTFHRIVENAETNKAPDREDTFRFKWNGLFYLAPTKDAFMARLRIPGGQLKSYQLREIAAIATELTTGYIQITTRANLQIRLIEPKNAPEVLRRIQLVGLHTRGAGADNIRNLTSNPTAGIDPHELIDCTPYVQELARFIINQREFYDLPRKFNVAFNGGGLIGSVEDTNDLGVTAVRRNGEIFFRIAAGGATGHKVFARDLGVTIPPAEIVKVMAALIRVYIANGNRTDRKRARLKHLLENWALDQYVSEAEKLLGTKLDRSTADSDDAMDPIPHVPHSHLGAHPQRQSGLHYLGVAASVGQLTPKQLHRIADLANHYGSGEVRLTVWQNLIISNIPTASLDEMKSEARRIGLDWKQSNVASGVIACTGKKYCKFSLTETKGHALALIEHLESHLELDVPVNIHVTGCPHSCAQHYMGDIGLLGTKARNGGEAYHVCLGGGFGKNQAVGRQVFNAVPFEELKPLLEKILLVYLKDRSAGESFQAFTARHDLEALQVAFGA
jgi:ferredoxin-nitrite reductase